MRTLSLLILVLYLAGCENQTSEPSSRLTGTWFSNKELSLLQSDLSSIKPGKLKFLKENLGDMGFVFKNNQMTVIFKSDPFTPKEFIEFEVTNSTDDSITIKPDGGLEAKYTFEGDCYFIKSGKFTEYFCREKQQP